MRHPPDRQLDPPEPTDAELREEKLRDEWLRDQESQRAQAAEALSEVESVLTDALGPDGAREKLDPVWKFISESGRAA